MKNGSVRVGIIGSQFQADCHAAAIGMVEEGHRGTPVDEWLNRKTA